MSEEKKKPFFSRDLLITLSANAVSIVTLLIFVYQTNLMRDQQHMSVWPYLEWLPSCCTVGVGGYLEIENKGVGPAIIQSVEVRYDSQEVKSVQELFTKAIGTDRFNYSTSTVDSRVMTPGETIRMYSISDINWAFQVDSILRRHNLEINICYCNVYKECWMCKGTSTEPTKKCPKREVVRF